MKALVYTGVETLQLRDVGRPSPGGEELLVKVESVGICGSDMHAFLGHDERRPAPLILGHEAAGTIVEGEGAGRRVTINPLVSCGHCRACREGRSNLCPDRQILSLPPREGAFAEFVLTPPDNIVAIPDAVPTEKAALAEPIACGWHAVRLAREALYTPLEEASCLVIGGGAIGLGAALVLKAHGAGRILIAETNAVRRARLAEMENFDVADPGGETGLPAGSADLVIDAVGYAGTREAACRAVRPGGVIMHIGLGDGSGGLDIRRMTLQEITFIGTYTYTPDDFRQTAEAIFDGRLGPLDWTESRPLSDGARAFADIRAGKALAPKIILKP